MSYKIALVSSDRVNIDLHFGEITSVLVYSVNEDNGTFSFEEERKISLPVISKREGDESGCSCGQGFVNHVTAVIKDCQYFLVAKIGNRPHRLLQENKVNCIEAPFEIEEAVTKLNGYFVSHKKRESHVF